MIDKRWNKKKILFYAGVAFLLLFVGSSSALIDLTGRLGETGLDVSGNFIGNQVYAEKRILKE